MALCHNTNYILPFADIPESFLIYLLHLCFLLSVQCCWLFSRKLFWLQSHFYMQQKAGFFLPLSTPHPFQPLSSLIQPFLGGKGQTIILIATASFKPFNRSCTLMTAYENRLPPPFIHSYSSLLYWNVPNKSMSMYTKEVSDVLLNAFDKDPKKIL